MYTTHTPFYQYKCIHLHNHLLLYFRMQMKQFQTHTHTHILCTLLVSIPNQFINRASEGITATDGACLSAKGTCNLHHPIRIKRAPLKNLFCGRPTQRRSPDHIRIINKVINKSTTKSEWFNGQNLELFLAFNRCKVWIFFPLQ